MSDLMDVTSHPLATAYLHILEPTKPFPPQTTIFFAADFDIVAAVRRVLDALLQTIVQNIQRL